jgi:hypothetical protein
VGWEESEGWVKEWHARRDCRVVTGTNDSTKERDEVVRIAAGNDVIWKISNKGHGLKHHLASRRLRLGGQKRGRLFSAKHIENAWRKRVSVSEITCVAAWAIAGVSMPIWRFSCEGRACPLVEAVCWVQRWDWSKYMKHPDGKTDNSLSVGE